MHLKALTGKVEGFPECEPITPAELLALDCDILVPAALENTVTAENAPRCGRRSSPKPPTAR